MNLTKDDKGITLAALVITIIVLLIIGGVSIYTGISSMKDAEDGILISEMEQVKNFIGQSYFNYLKTEDESFFVGTEISDSEVIALIQPRTIITIPEEYYIDSNTKKPIARFRTLNQEQLESVGIEKCQNEYIVNYLTGEVINKTKKTTSRGDLLYTYIRKIFNNNDVTSF